jgi:hypothetical protein
MGYEMSTIRQLVSSRLGNVLAAAEFEKIVHLYDLASLERLHSFPTTLDFGGRRLAITDDGRTVFVGAYHRHGIAAYSSEDGQELWRRKDLKKVQQLGLNGDGSRLLCCFDRGPCECLNVATGKVGMSLRGVRRVWESPFAPMRLFERSRDYTIADLEASISAIPRVSFAILSVAFSPTHVCFSEAGGPVRTFDAYGTEAWRHTPPKGIHYLHVAFSEELQLFVGISWPFERGGRLLLQCFAPGNGSPTVITDVGPDTEMAFCLSGDRLVTSAGDVFHTPSGKRLSPLPFPCARPSDDAA